jgi:hypothetical protein
MSEDKRQNTSLLDHFSLSQILGVARKALEQGPDFPLLGYMLDKKFNISDMKIKDNALLIEYIPTFKNRNAIYVDICYIMSFIYNLLIDDLDAAKIYSIGVQAQVDSKPFIYIFSPNDSINAIKKKNWVYWLKNSIIYEPFQDSIKILLLVEGPTETNAYPILFNSMGCRIDAHGIDIFSFAESNLKTLLAILNYNKEKFYLTCDNDKSQEIIDLKRRGYLSSNFHVLEKGEFEDYVTAEELITILKAIDPNINLTKEYIEERRLKGKSTSKIISEYYNSIGQANRFPGKPKLGQEIANYWTTKGMPFEIRQIIADVMNII